MANIFANILASVTGKTIGAAADKAGKAIGSIMSRCGFTEKLSEADRIDKYVEVLHLDENSTADARAMFIQELQTQRMPWIIRIGNGIIRPFGAFFSLITEFYVIVGQNVSTWVGVEYIPITLTLEQHAFLLTCVCFYFGSRSREIVKGVTTQR